MPKYVYSWPKPESESVYKFPCLFFQYPIARGWWSWTSPEQTWSSRDHQTTQKTVKFTLSPIHTFGNKLSQIRLEKNLIYFLNIVDVLLSLPEITETKFISHIATQLLPVNNIYIFLLWFMVLSRTQCIWY